MVLCAGGMHSTLFWFFRSGSWFFLVLLYLVVHKFGVVGNANPFHYSCLENPIDRETCWAIVHGVSNSQTQPSDWAHSHIHHLPQLWTHTVIFSPLQFLHILLLEETFLQVQAMQQMIIPGPGFSQFEELKLGWDEFKTVALSVERCWWIQR